MLQHPVDNQQVRIRGRNFGRKVPVGKQKLSKFLPSKKENKYIQ